MSQEDETPSPKTRLISAPQFTAREPVGYVRVLDGVSVDEDMGERTLPDSSQLHGLCPRCNRHSNFELENSPYSIRTIPKQMTGIGLTYETVERVVLLRCRACSTGMVCCEEQRRPVYKVANKNDATYWRAVFHWPLPSNIASPDVPTHIASVYMEAVTAMQANLPRAAATMARAALDAITMDKGDSNINNLKKRLDDMATRGVLQPVLADWSHEVRLVGNDAVHDASVPVNMADARQLIAFIADLIKNLYELPAELQRRRRTTS